jgi:plastocyanin
MKAFFRDFKRMSIFQKSIFAVFIVVVGYFFAFHNHGGTSNPPRVDCSIYPTGKIINVIFTDTAFSPKTIKATVCDTLHIVNTGTTPHEPAIGSHPLHFEFPGYEPEQALEQNDSFDILLQHVGRFQFHDHIHDEIKGTLIIQPK